jgi:hypothetical protein
MAARASSSACNSGVSGSGLPLFMFSTSKFYGGFNCPQRQQ